MSSTAVATNVSGLSPSARLILFFQFGFVLFWMVVYFLPPEGFQGIFLLLIWFFFISKGDNCAIAMVFMDFIFSLLFGVEVSHFPLIGVLVVRYVRYLEYICLRFGGRRGVRFLSCLSSVSSVVSFCVVVALFSPFYLGRLCFCFI